MEKKQKAGRKLQKCKSKCQTHKFMFKNHRKDIFHKTPYQIEYCPVFSQYKFYL